MLTRRVAAGHWIPFQTSTTIRCNQVVSLTSQQMATYRHDLNWNFRRALLRGAPGLE